jgi:hypothetical protein
MKKLAFISKVAVTNLVLVLAIVSTFNPFNLPLLELDYFNGFAIHILFPSSVIGMTIFYGSFVSLFIVNRLFIKQR